MKTLLRLLNAGKVGNCNEIPQARTLNFKRLNFKCYVLKQVVVRA